VSKQKDIIALDLQTFSIPGTILFESVIVLFSQLGSQLNAQSQAGSWQSAQSVLGTQLVR
jgi:hypothetical protein